MARTRKPEFDQPQLLGDNCCKSCVFWRKEVDVGVCKRFPPVLVPILSLTGIQPKTLPTDWCGEWVDNGKQTI